MISSSKRACVCVCEHRHVLSVLARSKLEIRNYSFIFYIDYPNEPNFSWELYFCPPIYPNPGFLLHLLAMSANLSHTTMLSTQCLHNKYMAKLRFGPKKANSQVGHRWNAKQPCLKKPEWKRECNTTPKCQLLEMFNLWLCCTAGALTLE